MANLSTQPPELRFTIEIKRAETGKIEKYDMVGHVISTEEKEEQNGSNTLNSSS